MRVKRTWAAIISVVALSGMFTPAVATEKYWIAHEAELIILGTYHHNWSYPWFDGWRVSGRLDVDEVLFGRVVTRQVDLPLECGVPSMASTAYGRVVWR
jgi:hypothetical protein